MKKWIVPFVIVLLVFLWGFNLNNTAVELDEKVNNSWSKVESAYQRRNDLIGNLVKTVQGAADFERGTLKDVIEARAKATSTTIDASNINPENLQKFQEAQSGLTGALSRLLLNVERYPELKANKNFLELQSQLEGTENRINVARDRFNNSVEPYNNYVRKMPQKLILSPIGFKTKGYFTSDDGADVAPNVEFDFK
mgnify:CR=1 FL=1